MLVQCGLRWHHVRARVPWLVFGPRRVHVGRLHGTVHLRGWLHWRRLRRTAAVAFADARTDARTDACAHTRADTITDKLSNSETHAAPNSHPHPVPHPGTMHVNIQL